MAAYLGSVTFSYNLIWLRPAPNIVGSDVQARDGSFVSIRVASPSQTERLVQVKYAWESWATVQALLQLALTGGTYTMKPEDGVATTYTVRFAADSPVSLPKHSTMDEEVSPGVFVGKRTDTWEGTLNLIVVS